MPRRPRDHHMGPRPGQHQWSPTSARSREVRPAHPQPARKIGGHAQEPGGAARAGDQPWATGWSLVARYRRIRPIQLEQLGGCSASTAKTRRLLPQIGRLQRGQRPQRSRQHRSGPQRSSEHPAEIGRRLGKLTQDEEAVLGELRRRAAQPPPESRSGPAATPTDRHISELERDVITLDDLIGRQRLEELLAISDE